MTPVWLFTLVLLAALVATVARTGGVHRDILFAAVAVVGSAGLWLVGLAPLPTDMTVDVWRYSLPWFAYGCAAMSAVRAVALAWNDRTTAAAGSGLMRRLAEAASTLDRPAESHPAHVDSDRYYADVNLDDLDLDGEGDG